MDQINKEDTISRRAAMDLVKDVCEAILSMCGSHYDGENEVYDDLREAYAILKCNKEIRVALRHMPSAQPDLQLTCNQLATDCISRQAAIDAIDKYSVWVMYTQGDSQKDEAEFVENIIKQTKKAIQSMLIEDLSSAQPEPQWIPCSERLPEYDMCRTLTTINTHVKSGYYYKGLFYNDNGDTWKATDKEVIAWMPLPEPYKERQEE